MIERPTQRWRRDGSEASPAMIDATDVVLDAFLREAETLGPTTADDEVLNVVQRVVMALNRVDADHDDGDFLTIEREDLCEFIDDVIGAAGVDLDTLSERRGMERAELTDVWRDW